MCIYTVHGVALCDSMIVVTLYRTCCPSTAVQVHIPLPMAPAGPMLFLQAWFTFMDFDRGCIMPREEYQEAVHLLRQFSADPQQAKSYKSFDRWKADHRLHRRVEWDPQRALQEPITASQQIGWHAMKPHKETTEVRHPVNHTDVTLKEGRSASTYYGYMTLL
eukprot:GHUV01028166.1.p1 GENE.GHUV01028166.1~~GHUV01028166.1.p1  ORF type:complete len:163 (+),score=27.74 GHUV01028166.1:307-795(+)